MYISKVKNYISELEIKIAEINTNVALYENAEIRSLARRHKSVGFVDITDKVKADYLRDIEVYKSEIERAKAML